MPNELIFKAKLTASGNGASRLYLNPPLTRALGGAGAYVGIVAVSPGRFMLLPWPEEVEAHGP
jgi:hypothetical protein